MQSQWLEGDRVLILHAMETVLAWPLQMARQLKFYVNWGERACGWKRGAVSAWVRETIAGGRGLVAVGVGALIGLSSEGWEGWGTWTTGSSEARPSVRCGDEAMGAEADVHASAHATCSRQTGSSRAWLAAAWCARLHACMHVHTHVGVCARTHPYPRYRYSLCMGFVTGLLIRQLAAAAGPGGEHEGTISRLLWRVGRVQMSHTHTTRTRTRIRTRTRTNTHTFTVICV